MLELKKLLTPKKHYKEMLSYTGHPMRNKSKSQQSAVRLSSQLICELGIYHQGAKVTYCWDNKGYTSVLVQSWLVTETSSTEAVPGTGRVKKPLDLLGRNDGHHRLNMGLPCVLGGALWAQQGQHLTHSSDDGRAMHRAMFLRQSFPPGREKSLSLNSWHFTGIQLCRVE